MSRLARVFPYLIMLLLLSASPATAQVINLVTDGTMEAQDLAAWRAYGVSTFEKSNSDAYAGSWSMYAQGGFQQTVLTVEAGKTYVLKLQYRRKSGTFRVRVGIGTSNADYQGREFATSTSPDAWTVFERTLEMPAQMAGTFRLVFPLTGQVYVDEVSLRPDNLVNDGDMEAAGTASWRGYGTATYAKGAPAYNGTQCMQITAGGFQQYYVPMSASGVYRLSVAYRRTAASTFYIRVGRNTSNSDYASQQLRDSTSTVGEWRTYTRTMTMPANLLPGENMRLVFAGLADVDDVSIRAVELIKDWDAEAADLANWRNYGVPLTIEKVTAGVYAGTRSIHLAQGGTQQVGIPVVAGSTYNLSLYHRLSSGIMRVRLGINTSNTDFAGAEYTLRQTGDWTQYARTFTVPVGFTSSSDFRLVISTTGDVLLDNLSIRPQ